MLIPETYLCTMETMNEDSSTCSVHDLGCLPEDLKVLLESVDHGLPTVLRIEKPTWFDTSKFKTGQEFAIKYAFSVEIAELLTLFMTYTFDDGLKVINFTDKTGTNISAFKRYLSTHRRIKSWYIDDIFDRSTKGYQNLKVVQSMHSTANNQINEISCQQFTERIERLNDSKELLRSMTSAIEEDFKSFSCPFMHENVPGRNTKIYFNQFNMVMTQFAFIGLLVLYPERFGAINATQEELEGFIHLWKVLGHLLGIEDRYNICNGTLGEVKNRCHGIIYHWVMPNFLKLPLEWEHFVRCMVNSVNYYISLHIISFESMFMLLCDTLRVEACSFYRKMSWSSYFKYKFFKCILYFARWQCIMGVLNNLAKKAVFKAMNISHEELIKISNERKEC